MSPKLGSGAEQRVHVRRMTSSPSIPWYKVRSASAIQLKGQFAWSSKKHFHLLRTCWPYNLMIRHCFVVLLHGNIAGMSTTRLHSLRLLLLTRQAGWIVFWKVRPPQNNNTSDFFHHYWSQLVTEQHFLLVPPPFHHSLTPLGGTTSFSLKSADWSSQILNSWKQLRSRVFTMDLFFFLS